MIDRKEIDLIVRAQLKGGKDIDSITKSIAGLRAEIDRQTAAAKKGEGSIEDLKAQLLALQQVQDQLGSAAGLAGRFQKQQESLQKTAERVQRLSEEYTKHKAVVDAAGTATDKQQSKLEKLLVRYDAARATLASQQATLNGLATALKEAGIATDDLANAEQRARVLAADLGVEQAKVQRAIVSYTDDLNRAKVALKEKGEAERRAAQDAAQFAAAEKRAADAARARQQAAAGFDERNIVRRNEAQAFGQVNRQLEEQARRSATAAEFVRRWAAALDEADAKAAALAKNAGLNKLADDAARANREMTSLARASNNLTLRPTSIRDTVASILNPASAQRSTISGIEDEVNKITAAIEKVRGPVRDVEAQFKSLKASAQALGTQAGLVDAFRQQVVVLRQSRAEFVAARSEVAKYAAAVRQGGDAGAGFTAQLERAQANAQRAAQALRTQLAATRETRNELRAAGIETNNLAAAEQRLTNTATQATQATRSLEDAVKRYGTAAAGASRRGGLFGDEGRTTLSLAQRIRGELLALAAAYIGVQGAIGLAGDAANAFSQREGIRNQLALSVGNDRNEIDREYRYVKAQADRIGVEFETTARGYAKFAAAAKLAGRSRQEIRFIFEAFTEVSRVANLSKEDLDGVFKALEQITSKGKIQAEELRGQLGDRLFGAFQIAAKALKDTYPDLDKALKDGVVTADQLVAIAEEYRKTVGGQLSAATNSLAANQARLNTAVYDFKLAIADAGFANTYVELLQKLTAFLKSDDGKKFASNISSAFSALADVLIFLLSNLEEVKRVLTVVAGLWLSIQAKSAISNLYEAGKAFKSVGTEAGLAQKALVGFQAFVVGWNIGSYLYEKFAVVRKAGAVLVTSYIAAWEAIKGGAEIAFSEIPRFAENAAKATANAFLGAVKDMLAIFRNGAQAFGLDTLAKNIDSVVARLPKAYDLTNSRAAEIANRVKADIAKIKAIADDMIRDAATPPGAAAAGAGGEGAPTAKPTPGKPGPKPPTEEEIRKRATLIESIQRQIEQLDASIDRAEKKSLGQQLDAIDTQYLKLQRQIAKLGKGDKEGVAFLAQLEELKQQKKLQVTRQYNAELVKENESIERKLEAADAASGRKQKEDLDARLAAIKNTYAGTFREIEEFRTRLVASGASDEPAQLAKERLAAAVKAIELAEEEKFVKDELQRMERELNDLLAQRQARIKTIGDLEEAGLITSEEARRRVVQILDEMQPKIEELQRSGVSFAVALQGAFDGATLEEFLAKLQLAAGSVKAMRQEFYLTGKTINEMLASGATTAIDRLIERVITMRSETGSWNGVLKEVARTFLQFAADFLKQIALMIIKQAILNALQKNNAGGVIANAIRAIISHEGGVVTGTGNRTRNLASSIATNLPRYHEGGLPGLTHREQLIVAEKGEEILAKDSPRNILNGGAAAGGTPVQDAKGVRFVLVDDRDRVPEAMQSAGGERVVMQILRANLPTLKQWVK